jgi:hypothetical protein
MKEIKYTILYCVNFYDSILFWFRNTRNNTTLHVTGTLYSVPENAQLTGLQQSKSGGDGVQRLQRYLPRFVVRHARRVI